MENIFNITAFALPIVAALTFIYVFQKKHKVKYLVFSSVGDRNNIKSWTTDLSKKNFDLVLYYFGEEDNPVLDADLLVKRKGLKFENFHHYLEHNNIEKYTSIWIVDDDIIMHTASINKMFRLFSKYKLWLAQPSFDSMSLAPFYITRNNPKCLLRYTNFIENNTVVISTEVIPLLKDSFKHAGTGFGIDYVWTSILGYPENKIAVIDAVSCCHPISDYSALDEVIPRHLHKLQGAKLLSKYGLLASDWKPTQSDPWPKPFEPKEYSKVLIKDNTGN